MGRIFCLKTCVIRIFDYLRTGNRLRDTCHSFPTPQTAQIMYRTWERLVGCCCVGINNGWLSENHCSTRMWCSTLCGKMQAFNLRVCHPRCVKSIIPCTRVCCVSIYTIYTLYYCRLLVVTLCSICSYQCEWALQFEMLETIKWWTEEREAGMTHRNLGVMIKVYINTPKSGKHLPGLGVISYVKVK